ncbi:MAG: hypothetical protein E7183_02760 [Erysipelotrichaceae bacterium]|nr:hypothetical protein [Erysipelotrichaceae bacterium]
MIKRLFIILLFMVGLFFNVSCDNITFEYKEPEKITFESGIESLKEVKNFSVNLDMKTIYEGEIVEKMCLVNVLVQDNMQKIEITESGFVYTFYTLIETTDEEKELYIIFDPSMFDMDYSGNVKISLTEIKELFFDIISEEVNHDAAINETEEILAVIADLTSFFTTFKDEYFDESNIEDYDYIFNETGKEEFKVVMNEFIEVISGDPTISEKIDVDIDVTAKVNDKYITNIVVDLIGNNIDDGETEIIRFDTLFEQFGEVEITLPQDVITFDEFMELLQGSGSVEVA